MTNDQEAAMEATVQRGLAFGRVVAVLFLLGAILHAASLLQTLVVVWQYPSILCGELLFAGLAVVYVAAGMRIYDGSFAATLVGVAAAGFGAFFATVWFGYLFYWGLFVVLPVLLAAGSLFACLAALVYAPVARQVETARRKLMELP